MYHETKEYALITGASSGIGLEMANICAENKINLLLTARNESALGTLSKELSEKFGISVLTLVDDLSDPHEVDNIFEFSKLQGIYIKYLINNAGFGDFAFFPNADWKKTSEMINLNITSLTRLCHLYIPEMMNKRNGKILNVSSLAGFQPGPYMSVYYATKAYVLLFSEALRRELKGTGVSVTCLCPGPTNSLFWKRAGVESSRLIQMFHIPSSKQVAIYGYKSLMKNKSVAIYGSINKLTVFLERFIPRRIVTELSFFLNNSKIKN